MSGGHFYFSHDLGLLIEKNERRKDTLVKYKITEVVLRFARAMVHRIDWLESDEYGEDEFNERWDDDVLDYMINNRED